MTQRQLTCLLLLAIEPFSAPNIKKAAEQKFDYLWMTGERKQTGYCLLLILLVNNARRWPMRGSFLGSPISALFVN